MHKTGHERNGLPHERNFLKRKGSHPTSDRWREREALPWVKIDRNTSSTPMRAKRHCRSLQRRSQLLISISCSGGLQSRVSILLGDRGRVQRNCDSPGNHDVMFWAVSRAPLEQLNEYKKRMRWTFPWASSFGSDFISISTFRYRGPTAQRDRIQLSTRAADGTARSAALSSSLRGTHRIRGCVRDRR